MNFRRLTEEEKEVIAMAFDRVGCQLTGGSYVEDTGTYYVGLYPNTQATPRSRKLLEGALGTKKLVLNGRVKV